MSDLIDKVYRFCTGEDLLKFDGVIVGLSGGPDSVALIKTFIELRSRGLYNGDIRAVHINHNMRPGDCDRDEEFVRNLCRDLDIPLVCESFDIIKMAKEDGRTEEEEGRIVRYRVFEQYKSKLLNEGLGTYAIAVAHHGDDLAETFMMNLFRGSGLEGLRGIKPGSGDIIRPFLCVTKKDILEFLGDDPYCIDHTNSELNSTRNIWRNKILPQISEVSIKEPEEAIRDTSALLASDLEFISGETYRAFDDCKVEMDGFVMLDCTKAAGLHKAILSRVIRHLFLYAAGSLKDFETVNLNIAMDMVKGEDDAPDRADMPFGITGFRVGALFGFVRHEDLMPVMRTIADALGFVTASPDMNIVITPEQAEVGFASEMPDSLYKINISIIENYEDIEYNNKSWFCPISDITGNISVHGCLGASQFSKAGSSGSKQVRRIYTDLKVPREIRDEIIGISDGEDILFIPGIGHSKGFVSPRSKELCAPCGRLLEIRFEERRSK